MGRAKWVEPMGSESFLKVIMGVLQRAHMIENSGL